MEPDRACSASPLCKRMQEATMRTWPAAATYATGPEKIQAAHRRRGGAAPGCAGSAGASLLRELTLGLGKTLPRGEAPGAGGGENGPASSRVGGPAPARRADPRPLA